MVNCDHLPYPFHITATDDSEWTDLVDACHCDDIKLHDPDNADICSQIKSCNSCACGICDIPSDEVLCKRDTNFYCKLLDGVRPLVKCRFGYRGILWNPPCECLNGGTLSYEFGGCDCKDGFMGERCENVIDRHESEEAEYSSSTSTPSVFVTSPSYHGSSMNSAVLAVIIICLIVFFTVYCIRGYYRAKNNVRDGVCSWMFPQSLFRRFFHCWSSMCKKSYERDDRPFILAGRTDSSSFTHTIMQEDQEVMNQLRIGMLALAGAVPQPLMEPEGRSANPSGNPSMARVSSPPPIYAAETDGPGHSSGQSTGQRLMPPSYNEALNDGRY